MQIFNWELSNGVDTSLLCPLSTSNVTNATERLNFLLKLDSCSNGHTCLMVTIEVLKISALPGKE